MQEKNSSLVISIGKDTHRAKTLEQRAEIETLKNAKKIEARQCQDQLRAENREEKKNAEPTSGRHLRGSFSC
jgi:hypothetical protein